MLAEIGVPMIVFGIIFLLVTILGRSMMTTSPENPNCSEDVNDVKTNKKLYKWFLIAEILVILVGVAFVAV